MLELLTASPGTLNIQLGSYVPLIVVCGALAVLFLIFKLVGVSSKILWRLLINGIIGAAMLSLFDIVFVTYLGMRFFYIPITWISSVVAGVFGIPGVILLLALQFIL